MKRTTPVTLLDPDFDFDLDFEERSYAPQAPVYGRYTDDPHKLFVDPLEAFICALAVSPLSAKPA